MDTQNTTEMQDIVASCVTTDLELGCIAENSRDGGDCAFYPEGTQTDKLSFPCALRAFRYSGENYLPGIPTRNDIVAENDKGSTAIIEQALANYQDIPFMPVDIEETDEYINGIPHYALRLYGTL